MSVVQPRTETKPPTRLKLKLIDRPAERSCYDSWQGSLASHYTMIPNGLLRGELDLTNDEQAVLVALLTWNRGRGSGSVTVSHPGGIRIPSLARWANQSRTQTYRSLKMLSERGYIAIEYHTGEPSEYTLHLDYIAQHLTAPPPADTPTPATTPAERGTTPNKWAKRCKKCGQMVGVGEGVMRGNGPEHIDCGVPAAPTERLLFGKYKSSEEHRLAQGPRRQR